MVLGFRDLKSYAFRRGLHRKDMIVLDYIQDKFLYSLSTIHDLTFSLKGGTALYKLYNSGRFSRDIDLDFKTDIDLKAVIKQLSMEGFAIKILKERQTENTVFLTIGISRRDIVGQMAIDISLREAYGDTKLFYSPYPDIPPFKIRVSTLDRILEDKLDAIIRRKKPRDLYDAYIITRKYGITKAFNRCSELRRSINSIKPLWYSLRELVLVPLPRFEETRDFVLKSVRC